MKPESEIPTSDNIRAYRWVFTQYDLNYNYDIVKAESSFLIYGVETCPTTQRQHHQGYIEFKDAKTFSKMKKYFPGVHIEKAKADADKNITYCTKEDKDAFRHGDPTGQQGRRTDLEEIRKELLTTNIEEIADKHFSQWCQYGRQFKEYQSIKEVKRNWIPEVILLYGESGTGKTRKAIEDGGVIVEWTTSGFINGYNGEDTVIFDDVDIDTLPPRTVLLKLLDRYPYAVNIKGGTRNWKPKKIYFTTNSHPDELLINSDPALKRRFTEIIEIK